MPPVTREEVRRPFPTITHFAEDTLRFESTPVSPPAVPPAQEARTAQPATPELDTYSDEFDDGDEGWFDDQLIVGNGHPNPSPRPRRESIFDRFLRSRRERGHRDVDDDPGVYDDFAANGAYDYPHPTGQAFDFETGPYDAVDAQDAQLPPPRHQPEMASRSRNDRVTVAPGLSDLLESAPSQAEERWDFSPGPRGAPGSSRPETGVTAPAPPRQVADELPRWDGFDQPLEEFSRPAPNGDAPRLIAPDLPRICRTCRDFRPAESGERGWCNNAWAFKHRRMVDADTLSCETSYGTWWVAHDGVWQKSADIARHALETPLLDRLLASHNGSDGSPPVRHTAGRGR